MINFPSDVDPNVEDILADGGNVPDPEQQRLSDLAAYIRNYAESWRDLRRSLYDDKLLRYSRYANAIFAEDDRTRSSEKSKLVSPLTLAAIRSVSDELAETVMPQGQIGMLTGGGTDVNFGAAREEFRRRITTDNWEVSITRASIIAATYGSALGELVIDKTTDYVVGEQEDPNTGEVAVGTTPVPRVKQTVNVWAPSHFLADYNCSTLADSQGVIIEEVLPMHVITRRMAEGEYYTVPVQQEYNETTNEIEADRDIEREGVLTQRWYGLVPKDLMGVAKNDPNDPNPDSGLVEAIVILCSGRVVMDVVNPSMRQNRGLELLQFELIPGRLLGRGIPEAGEMMQRAYDSSIRSHMDSLAVTSTPVTVTDATRFPRGLNMSLYAGRNIPVSGDLASAIQRLDLGQTDPMLLQTASTFERLFMSATGTLDSGLLPDLMKAGASQDALMMAMAALVRRNRQRSTFLQRNFLIPLLTEAYYRYVQFEPNNFPVIPPKLEVTSTTGMLERHLETQRRVSIAATLGPDSPLTAVLVGEIIEMSDSRNREKYLSLIQQMIQQKMEAPDRAAAEAQQQNAIKNITDIEKTKSETAVNYERAALMMIERQLMPRKVQADLVGSLSKNIRDNSADNEFEKRVKIMDRMLAEEDLEIKRQDVQSRAEIGKLQALSSGNIPPEAVNALMSEVSGRQGKTEELLSGLLGSVDADEEFDYDENDRIIRRRRVPKQAKGD